MRDLTKIYMESDPNYELAYNNRGIVYSNPQGNLISHKDLIAPFPLKSTHMEAIHNRAIALASSKLATGYS